MPINEITGLGAMSGLPEDANEILTGQYQGGRHVGNILISNPLSRVLI